MLKKLNKKEKISFETLNFPAYEDIKTEIIKKAGQRPGLPKDLPVGVWGEKALKVLQERYLLRNEKGEITEMPEELCWRVAWEAASAESCWGKTKKEIEEIAKDFYNLLIRREFLPNSPTLMNAGTGNNLQYSACFVLPVEDSLVGIFDAIKYQALIHQTGGGTGFSFSRLRSSGSVVKSSSGTASGPVSFMRVFDAATNEIKQGGKRRGANMGILRVDHPDILEFIHCKEKGGITNFNISVGITHEFMKAYEEDRDYDLIDPRKAEKKGSLSAKKVFEEIVESAWKTGDPGLIFIDRINKGAANPVPELGPIEATNPCGEQPLYPYDACNLGSIFLNQFVITNGEKEVDWEKLKTTVWSAIRFLDNIIEVNPFPLAKIRQTVLGIRRVGLGVGGWADMLIKLKIPYDSEEALVLAEKIMKFIQTEAIKASEELAKQRGPFPLWQQSIYKNKKPRRNSTVTTIAPTGSISIIANASSGVEPLFAVAYQHKVKDKNLDRTLTFFNPEFEEVAKNKGIWTDVVIEKVLEQGTIRNIKEVSEDLREIFATAHEIPFDWHIKMQVAFQKYTDNAVSKTINLKHSATTTEVKEAYLLAWQLGCKGITVFRDGSKEAQVLNLGIKEDEKKEPTLDRPFKVAGATYKLVTPVGTAFVTINEDVGGEPLEVFINVGKAGSDLTAIAEALGRTISTALRFRGHLTPKERAKEIAHQLSGIGGRRSVGFGLNKIRSLPDAIAGAISYHFGFKLNGKPEINFVNGQLNGQTSNLLLNGKAEAGAVADNPALAGHVRANSNADPTLASAFISENQLATGDICPSCGASSFVYEEGCSKCYACGYSEC